MKILKYKIKHCLRHENNVNENKVLSYYKALRSETVKNNKKGIFLYAKLTNLLPFKLDFQKVDQHTRGKWFFHNTKRARTISCKAWNSPVEYHSRECQHDINESEGNMFNPIFKENVQGRKHPGSCAFAEPKLLSCRKPKRVVQMKKNAHEYPNNSHNYHDENHDEI